MKFEFPTQDPSAFAGDLLVVLVSTSSLAAALAALDGAPGYGGALAPALQDEDFTGKPGSTVMLAGLGKVPARRVLFVGAGVAGAGELHAAAGVAGNQARNKGAKNVGVCAPGVSVGADGVRGLVEGYSEGNYRFDRYKSEAARKAATETLSFLGIGADPAAVGRASASAAGQALARDLVNEPAAVVYPESLAAVAVGLATPEITVTAGRSAATAFIVPMTAAAPAMSQRMVSMPSEGLSESPPESKVTPLPTRATCAFEAPGGV